MGTIARNLMIVEGPGDRHFINHLLMSRGFAAAAGANAKNFLVNKPNRPGAAAIKIIVAGSFDSIGTAIEDEFRPDETAGLAIVADMDLLEDNRWESLRGTLASYGCDLLTKVLPKDGLVAREEQNPALGVWMMPDNESAGMLESFACRLVAGEDSAWVHARETVATLPEGAARFSRERDLEKALIHTWLAWQEEPGCQPDHDDVGRFCSWIERWLAASEGAGFRFGGDYAF